MTHEEKLQIDLLWYQAMEECVKEDSVRYAFAALVAAAERDKWEAKFKQLEALMQVREQQPNKPCCLAEREACAKVCDVRAVQDGWEGCYADECAAEIRARGKA